MQFIYFLQYITKNPKQFVKTGKITYASLQCIIFADNSFVRNRFVSEADDYQDCLCELRLFLSNMNARLGCRLSCSFIVDGLAVLCVWSHYMFRPIRPSSGV
jgi:hypothetical protein